MFHIIYMSSAIVPFSQSDLESLLQVSRRNNVALAVTGLLLYKDGNFLQTLEGEQLVVENLFSKISADSRHTKIATFIKEDIAEREFPNWSMGFRDLTTSSDDKCEGFNEILNMSQTAMTLFPIKLRAFMKMFTA